MSLWMILCSTSLFLISGSYATINLTIAMVVGTENARTLVLHHTIAMAGMLAGTGGLLVGGVLFDSGF